MNNRDKIFIIIFSLLPGFLFAQNIPFSPEEETKKKSIIHGFVRGGFYGSIDDDDDKPYISSAFSDFGLNVESTDNIHFKAFADLRFRYGTEFLEPVSRIDLREAYVRAMGKTWDITAGQTIIKWGRADFTNPTSKLNPRNYISRSPDTEDMDLGNLLFDVRWHPVPLISLEAVALPYYRSSVLLIDPLPLPAYVKIDQITSLLTEKEMFSYGLKTDLHLSGTDMSLSWFDGYDPQPGVALTSFTLDFSGVFPLPDAQLAMTPYKIRNLGLDFESTLGSIGLRGEAAWSFPYESFKTHEYVPLSEIRFVIGIDWMSGNWRFTGEYQGKVIPGFEAASVEPFIGTEPDLNELAMLMADPDFILEDYVRQQVGAFNRLYNYQLERSYHSAGLRIETDLFYGKLTPSVFSLYNFTSRDFLLMPEIKYKPADGLTISAGGEFYSGRKGSVYDLIHEFMNCIRAAIRFDF